MNELCVCMYVYMHNACFFNMISTMIHNRYYAKPKIKIQKMQNLAVAFKFMKEVEHIPIGNISKFHIIL